MTATKASGIIIEYEEMDLPDAPVVLLIMALGVAGGRDTATNIPAPACTAFRVWVTFGPKC